MVNKEKLMASVRVNVHRQPNPRELAEKFFCDHTKKNGRVVYWDTQGHGISLCTGPDWDYEAKRSPIRFVRINSELDLDEVFRNYEDGE